MTLLEAICISGLIHEVHPPAHIVPGQPVYVGWVFQTEEQCDQPSRVDDGKTRERTQIQRVKKGSK